MIYTHTYTNHSHEQQFQHAVMAIQRENIFIHAVQQLEQLAQHGHQQSASYLAQLYKHGFRVEKDSAKAIYWDRLAHTQQTIEMEF
ncbi:MAG: hypothetical protein Q4D05_05720 [Acinetobacter sp.]|nr:hypothetical protein [Acinetobacter sp.]